MAKKKKKYTELTDFLVRDIEPFILNKIETEAILKRRSLNSQILVIFEEWEIQQR